MTSPDTRSNPDNCRLPAGLDAGPGREAPGERPRIATVLIGIGASGTERRMACVFEHLARRHPGRHLLIVNRGLYEVLSSAGFALPAEDIRVLEYRSLLDRKKGAHSSLLTNAGRLMTLLRYRREVARICRARGIVVIQALLEMVPVFGLRPLPRVTQVASLVSHLPKYYDGRSLSSRILRASLRNYRHVDALYEPIAKGVAALGVPREKISHPLWNCVDHIRFRPEPKEDAVTFTGRAYAFKHPDLMLRAVKLIRAKAAHVRFHVLGSGPMIRQLLFLTRRSGLASCVEIAYRPDPSPVVNRSKVHVCLEEYDNATNQSLLEGLAAGCAIVASHVGQTGRVVTPDIGILVPLRPERIADAVLSLLDRPDVCEAMGRAARERALRNHNIDHYLDYLTDILSQNLEAHERETKMGDADLF